MIRLAGAILVSAVLAAACASTGPDPTAPTAPRQAAGSSVVAAPAITIGDLVAKGGRQLTAPEVKALFAGSKVEGVSADSTWWSQDFPDGTVMGEVSTDNGFALGYRGEWWVDEKGRRCWVNSRRTGGTNCLYYYGLADKYYASESDPTDKSAVLSPRKFTR